VLLLSSALVLGFLHGLGADHLMAIAALTARGETRRAHVVAIAVRFALGHALVLAFGAGIVILLGWSIPEAVERGGEALGGLLLIALGGGVLWAAASGRVYAHAHPHDPDPGAWHLHLGRAHAHREEHSKLPAIMGAVFAISSLRALSTLAPFGGSLSASLPLLLLLIAVFAVGILMSMSLFGVALARTLSTRFVARLGGGAALLMAVASIGLGLYWALTALDVF
jgi:nickel/cobalt transporter (NicO) family protein